MPKQNLKGIGGWREYRWIQNLRSGEIFLDMTPKEKLNKNLMDLAI